MQSSGGLCDVATAKSQCIQMLESGPAAGVVGASVLAAGLDTRDLICFDMGGTTAKACVLQDGIANLSPDFFVGGYNEGLAIRIPVLDIKEVGTGGGSIAWIDEAGGLHVGPQSAGASPGPACYGRGGTHPTVTDAHLVLGRLSPERFADGRLQLDAAAAERAIRTEIAEPLGIDLAAGCRRDRRDRDHADGLRGAHRLDRTWARSARLRVDRLRRSGARCRPSTWPANLRCATS